MGEKAGKRQGEGGKKVRRGVREGWDLVLWGRRLVV